LSILQGNSCSIDQKSGGIWTVQMDLQQIYPKYDRLLGGTHEDARNNAEDAPTKITVIVATEVLEAFYAGLFLSGYAPEKYR